MITLRCAANDAHVGEAPDGKIYGLQGFPASCISLSFVSKALSSAALRRYHVPWVKQQGGDQRLGEVKMAQIIGLTDAQWQLLEPMIPMVLIFFWTQRLLRL